MLTLVNTLIFYSFQQLSCQQDVPNITHQEKFSLESSSSTIFHYYGRRLFFSKGLINKFSLVLVRR